MRDLTLRLSAALAEGLESEIEVGLEGVLRLGTRCWTGETDY